jgi:hypothetical protein
MALRVAIASGNWSNPAIWNNGVLPSPGDIVASNNFTVTIDQNINVDTLTNAATGAGILTPQMTSNTTPSGIVTASSNYGGGYDPFLAFNRNPGDTGWITSANNITGWVAYEFISPKIVASYQVFPAGPGSPTSVARDWTFEGWNGSTYIVLDTVTGNSGTATVTRSIANTTAYIKYRLNITANNGNGNYTGTTELYLLEANDYGSTSTAGGGFIANSSVTITCTSTTGITGGSATTPLTISAASPAVVSVNSNLTNFGIDNSRVILKTGNCTLNITGNTIVSSSGSNRHWLEIAATGTTNFIGNIRGVWAGSNGIRLTAGSAGAILNITGNINPDKQLINAQNSTCVLVATVCTVNITGEIYGDWGNSVSLNITAAATINVTGNIYGGQNGGSSTGGAAISSGVGSYINIIGIVSAQHTVANSAPALVSTSSSAINLLSGPFVCSPEGYFPYQVTRMHLIPTTNSYFEFRDETTNGALSPGAIAPATRLVSPATLVDNLAVSDVRFGTSYALGTLTGTLRMPVANQVTFGVQVDNTFGNAVLTADGIWNYLVTNLNTPDSIGMRLKNVSTPQTTGEQLEAFLRLD